MRTVCGVALVCLLAGCAEPPAPIRGPQPNAVTNPPPAERPPQELTTIAPPPAEPTFPGLAETQGGPAPRIADFEITLERTPCFGRCPIYTVGVRGDGSVTYEGKGHVGLVGRAETKIDPASIEPILRELEAIDFLRHVHTCRSVIVDTPGTSITLRVGGIARTFSDEYGGRECGLGWDGSTSVDPTWHAGIDRIGKLIGAAVDVEQWIGTPEERSEMKR